MNDCDNKIIKHSTKLEIWTKSDKEIFPWEYHFCFKPFKMYYLSERFKEYICFIGKFYILFTKQTQNYPYFLRILETVIDDCYKYYKFYLIFWINGYFYNISIN